jgi:hypothetical protein
LNLAESLDELNNARQQLLDAAWLNDRILLRRISRVILRLCAVVYAIATTLQNTQAALQQLRSDFNAYVATHP